MASQADAVGFVPTAGGTSDWVFFTTLTRYRTPVSNLVDGATYHWRAESADGTQWENSTGTWTNSSQTAARTTVNYSSTGSKVNFSSAPNVTVVPHAADFGGAKDARRNRIVNGAMQISQENGNTAGTTTGYYPADQWVLRFSASSAAVSIQRVQSVTLGGASDRLRLSVTTAKASLSAGDYCYIEQRIEGLLINDAQFGSASAKTLIASAGIKFPVGTYGLSLSNAAGARSWVGMMTVAANADGIQTLTISGDTTGTWPTGNTASMYFRITIAAGSTYQGSAGWSAGNYLCTNAQTNGLSSNTNVFDLFDSGLYVDADITGAAPAWELPAYDDELRRCFRYWQKLGGEVANDVAFGGYNLAGGGVYTTMPLGTPMRTAPAGSKIGTFSTINCGQPVVYGTSTTSFVLLATVTANGAFLCSSAGAATYITLNARM